MILAWENKADAATITAGSEIATLPAANLKDPHVAKKWHTPAGVKSAHLLVDFGAPVSFSVLALLGANLSSAGTVRLRASLTDAAATAALEIDTAKMPAGVKAGYGAVYRHFCRGRYVSISSVEKPSLAFDFTAGHLVPVVGRAPVTCSRASAATRVNHWGYIESVPADTPRFDYDPDTRVCKGLLIEEERTNIVTHNGALADGSVWFPIPGAVNIVANAAMGPDGMLSAFRINLTGAANDRVDYFTAVSAPAGGTYTYSVYMKGSGQIGMALNRTVAGGTANEQLVTLTDKWQRFTITHTFGAAEPGNIRIHLVIDRAGGATQDIYVWRPQVELGAFASSVIFTDAVAVTRNKDDVETPVGPWFNPSEGTLVAEWTENMNAIRTALHVTGVANGRLLIQANSGPGVIRNLAFVAGVAQVANLDFATSPLGTVQRTVFAYKAGDYAASANGAAVLTNNHGAVPTGLNMMQFGSDAGSFMLNSHLRRISVYRSRRPNAELPSAGAFVDAVNEPSGRYCRIDIADDTLPDNLQIGRLFLGPSWTTPQSQGAGLEFGWGVTPHDPSEEEESAGGQTYPEERPQRRVLQFSLDWGTEQEMYKNVFAMARAAGVVRDVLAILQPDSAYISEQAVWGQLQAPQPLVHRSSRTFRQQFTVKERL